MALASSGRLLYVNNSNLLWQVMERSGRAPQVSGRLWLVLGGFRKLWGRFWTVLGVSGKLWRGSGWALARLWTALDGALEAALERIWKALDGFDWFGRGLGSSRRLWTALDAWKALDGSLELARSLPNVGNHAPTSGGKHILLSQCFTSPKRARWRKS